MADPFIGEIKMVGFNFAPRNWAFCDGAQIAIAQNQTLYSLLGTIYGGDGRTNFALPDLRGRVPVHPGAGIAQGQAGGSESVTLDANTMPQHTHPVQASSDNADQRDPTDGILAATVEDNREIYGSATGLVDMNAAAVTPTGGGQAHNNIQPIQVVNFVIALQGLYPSRN